MTYVYCLCNRYMYYGTLILLTIIQWFCWLYTDFVDYNTLIFWLYTNFVGVFASDSTSSQQLTKQQSQTFLRSETPVDNSYKGSSGTTCIILLKFDKIVYQVWLNVEQ